MYFEFKELNGKQTKIVLSETIDSNTFLNARSFLVNKNDIASLKSIHTFVTDCIIEQ